MLDTVIIPHHHHYSSFSGLKFGGQITVTHHGFKHSRVYDTIILD
ncbi:hypothetical protein SAMN05444266_11128 [Chitinophaga jiangningensis]|uniref:Uncharacterized protein n=1 Tax=Chitinophaga jiangningensis TaxID=1419482 RepID=A0A1M7LLH9_9BACT|nr:hypothetical protein [Chitinophaga jiangningensis]SHM78886.1 hypothetical protein SAMN05444266_11128 [Chitinophaga jiangningensis]